ncbi:PTS system glucitol/sorbitol-specific transporter subunit IIA [Klebsiella pneumoniae]|uniref:PTS system glucitol/sorbitol-specific transporter subunit IIA n=1 Tax=Klebsiella pneumoniae TaxID=573 RepID=A0A2X3CR22_KLEPN|nr:PTS system glucitol/sorbitol-specific transporter subunit IIA [Klebsiella pneumoniae]
MSVPLYSLRITAVGEYVEYSLRELRLILFSDAVPDDIASYCAVHQASELTAELSPGQQMKLNDKKLSGDRGRPCGNGKFTTAWPYHAKF